MGYRVGGESARDGGRIMKWLYRDPAKNIERDDDLHNGCRGCKHSRYNPRKRQAWCEAERPEHKNDGEGCTWRSQK